MGYHQRQRRLVLSHVSQRVPRVHLQEARECHKQLSRRSCSTASTHPSAVRGPTQVPPHLPPHHLIPHLPQSVVYLQKQENVTKQLSRRSCSTASTHPSAVRGPTHVPPHHLTPHHLTPHLPQSVVHLQKQENVTKQLSRRSCSTASLPTRRYCLCQRTQELRYRHLKIAHDAFVSELGNGGACALQIDQVAIIAYIVYPRRPTHGLNVTP